MFQTAPSFDAMRDGVVTAAVATMLALAAQYAFTRGGVSYQTIGAVSSMAPEPDPERVPAAKSEREINEQQQRSAERLAQLTATEEAPDIDPDDVRRQSEDDLIGSDLAMRCGQKLPPESAWTTRG